MGKVATNVTLSDTDEGEINPATEDKQDVIIAALGGITSTDNTSTTLLASGATFTGTFEQNDYPNVGVSCHSDIAGTLYFDFSPDGTNVNSFPTTGFTVTAGIHEFHTAVKLGRYFRVRFVMDAGTQTYMRLYTYYGENFLPSSAPIGFTIGTDADAIVTKSVISGVGDTNAKVTNHEALQVLPPPEGRTAFGEQLASEVTPVIDMAFHTFINPVTISSRANQSGTVTNADSMAVLTTGAAANSSAAVLTNENIRYKPGQGIRARFSGLFTTGVSDSIQIFGIGDEGNGFFFGYNGTSFGVLHRTNGVRELRTLTISAGADTSTGDDDITITLDGDAKVITLTDFTGDATITANEIAAADYSDTGRGWDACAVGDLVTFTSWNDEPRSGTYSLVDDDATGAAGTFAQTIVGVSPTDTWIAQASWNGNDKFDGTGISGVTLDPTKGNVFQIAYQWLGFGAIHFFIEDSSDGEFHLVHTIAHSNTNVVPSIARPTLGLRASVENVANTSSLVMKVGSMAAFVDGKDEYTGTRTGVKASKTLSGVSVETPIITLRCNEIFNSKHNHGELKISLVGGAVEHTKPVAINFYANVTLVGASFANQNATFSQAQIDTSATSFSGGVFLFGIDLGKTGSRDINLKDDKHAAIITPGNSITATVAPTSGNGAEGLVIFNFIDLF